MNTIQILTFNNENTIKSTLESLKSLRDWNIIIIDNFSTDKTLSICKEYNCDIKQIKINDRSKIRNEFSSEINLYIEPWEELLYSEYLSTELKESNYLCRILNNNIITKEIRIWKKDLKFENPIYETIYNVKSSYCPIIFLSQGNKNYSLNEIQLWKKNNLVQSSPYYYEALKHLSLNQYSDFLLCAKEYLLREKKCIISSTMLKYYVAMVEFIVYKNYEKSLEYLSICLNANLLMAEFWCLIGDIYLYLGDKIKAFSFYENALILGNRRLENDEWPIYLNKYDEYPKQKIKEIKNI